MKISEDLMVELNQLKIHFMKPNIFVFMKNLNYEIRHSNFLAWLVDKDENHNQDQMFLRRILSEFKVENDKSSYYKVANEVTIKNGRKIDLLLQSKNHVIIIENKTKTEDHMNQLRDYRLHAEKTYKRHRITFLYLSLGGGEPKDVEERKHWSSVSYLQVYEALNDTIAYISCRTTKGYVADYLHALGTYFLKNTDTYLFAKNLITRRRREIQELLENRDIKIPTDLDYTLNFLEKNIGKSLGKGFFGNENIYFDAFTTVIEKRKFLYDSDSNSTYFRMIPGEWTGIEEYCDGNPIKFNFNYLPGPAEFNFFITLPKIKSSKKKKSSEEFVKFRKFLEENRDMFVPSGSFKQRGGGKEDITLLIGRIEFNASQYSLNEITNAVQDIFDRHVIPTVAPYRDLVLRLYDDYKLSIQE